MMMARMNMLFILTVSICLAAILSVIVSSVYNTSRPSWKALLFASAPSLLALGLFYSLAIHMHQSLGAWPQSIGEAGFSDGLVAHVHAAISCFYSVLQATLFLWPVAFVVCLLVRPWRRGTFYLGVHVLAFALCYGLMQLAPSPFLWWWRD